MFKKLLIIGVSIFVGATIGAISYNNVLAANGLMVGGLGGIALLLSKFTGWNIQLLLLLSALPILIWAFVKYGIKQIAAAFICYGTFTFMVGVASRYIPVFHTDQILAALTAGVMFGMYVGLVLRLGLANGPEALVGMQVKEKYNIPVGTFFTVVNIIIVSSSLLYADLKTVLYSFIVAFISGKVANYITFGFKHYYEVSVISDQYIEITNFIHNNLKRSATFIQCLGTYNLTKHMMVKTLISDTELMQLKAYISKVDPGCFVFIHESKEVLGKGFKD